MHDGDFADIVIDLFAGVHDPRHPCDEAFPATIGDDGLSLLDYEPALLTDQAPFVWLLQAFVWAPAADSEAVDPEVCRFDMLRCMNQPNRDAQRSVPTMLLLAGLLGAMSAIAVNVLLPYAVQAEPGVIEATGGPAYDGLLDIVESIQSVERELAALRLSIDGASLQAGGPNASPLIPVTPELMEVLSKVTLILEKLEHASPGRPVEVDVARNRLHDLVHGNEMPPEEWRLWSASQLLEVYGSPERIEPTDRGLRWTYVWEDGTGLTFTINEGVVVEYLKSRPR